MSSSSLFPREASAPEVRQMGGFSFTVFERSGFHRQEPYITLEKGGRIYVNGAAGRLLGRLEKVVLLYDPQKRAIGIQSVESEPVDSDRKVFKTTKRNNRASPDGYAISAIEFFQGLNIDSTRSRRYAAEMVEGKVLTIRLDHPMEIVTRGPYKKKSQQA